MAITMERARFLRLRQITDAYRLSPGHPNLIGELAQTKKGQMFLAVLPGYPHDMSMAQSELTRILPVGAGAAHAKPSLQDGNAPAFKATP